MRLSRICSSEPAGKSESAISCFGNWLIPNCILPQRCGRISTPPNSIRPLPRSSSGSGALVAPASNWKKPMLKTRVITALVIAALLIPAIFFLNATAWAVVTAVITGIAGWEFARLSGFANPLQLGFGLLVGALAIALGALPAASLLRAGLVLLVLSVI